MKELHILLTPNKEHKKVFPDVPVIGFRNGKNLNDFLKQRYPNLMKVEDVNHVEKNLFGL